MSYTYTPQIWPSVFTFFLVIVLASFVWRKRSVPGALPFSFGLLFAILWAAGSALEFAAVDLTTKIAWVKFQTIWQLPAATAITCFILEYVWPGRWLTRRNLTLLAIVPLLVMGLILTDDLHHLVWGCIPFEHGSGANIARTPFGGPAGWLIVAYIYILGLVNLMVLVWLFRQSPKHRWPVVLILFAQISGRLIYTFEGVLATQYTLPFDVLLLVYLALFYFIALFGFRLFDPVSLARQTVMQQLSEGILVLDHQGRVASLNPAAEKIFGLPARQVKDRPVREILPDYPPENQEISSSSVIEFCLARNGATRDYRMAISPLSDWHGLGIGRLLLLQDVTEQKQAQATLLEQQRAVAALQERNRLARELHDELAQDLASINLQVQLVNGLLEAGQTEQAQAQLNVLAGVAREAQVDVRTEISKLAHRITQEHGLPGALKQYIDTFQQTYGIETELVVPEVDQPISIPAMVEAQLLRITQEAFTNIRKHASAKHACVSLVQEPECLKLVIEDDGVGFDPHSLPISRQAFGLGVMSARAQEVNGQVEVQSMPGTGTRVTVIIPQETA